MLGKGLDHRHTPQHPSHLEGISGFLTWDNSDCLCCHMYPGEPIVNILRILMSSDSRDVGSCMSIPLTLACTITQAQGLKVKQI